MTDTSVLKHIRIKTGVVKRLIKVFIF
uniref:Transcriptional regulator n=1 Tax=Heterorhabditis bacteriophora TaxID=37862 RepID=A0A1I7WXZ7_HETBA